MDAKLGLYNLYRIGKGALAAFQRSSKGFDLPHFLVRRGSKIGVGEGKPATN
jgi:hypothetical protein